MTCPHCGIGELSLPYGSKSRPGMVIQTCKEYQTCGKAVWSEAAAIAPAPVVDDGRRHGRMFLTMAPPNLDGRDRWMSVGRLAARELEALNRSDRKLAAAGGDR